MRKRYERKGRNTLGITTPSMHKRAALLFDKVFLVSYRRGPAQAVEDDSPAPCRDWLINRATLVPDKLLRQLNHEEEGLLFAALGELAETICKTEYAGYDLVPMYMDESGGPPDGTTMAYQAAFRSIPEVVEDQVEWNQIVQFRNDTDALTKYRALRTWLRDGLKARSVGEAEDLIADKLRQYEAALEKHGLKTINGCIKMLYDRDFLLQVAGVSGAVGVIWNPVTAAFASGLYIAGKVLLELSERRVELIDAQRENHLEVAVIYEAKKLAKA